MPLAVHTDVAMGPGTNITYRANPVSAIDMSSAVGMNARGRRRHGLSRRRVPSVNTANALLTVYTPVMKADTVIEGSMSKGMGEISDTERKIALATNTAGVVAAPAAVYGAVKAARGNQGGLPRAGAKKLARKLPKDSSIRRRALSAVKALDAPASTKAKVAAALAGAGMVGLQVANAAGDTIAARAMAGAKKEAD